MFNLFNKISNGEVYIIAEMSANHAGKLENALEIVRQSVAAGADCVKIQTYTADTITIDCDNENFQIHGGLWDGYKLHDLYTDAGTPWEWQARIKEECDKCGVDFLSTPFDNTAVDFLEEIGCEAYKIASFELVDIPLIEYTAAKGKPMIISCGMGSIEEIQDAVDACHRVGNDQVVLLKCCSEYPAKWDDMHLANIPDMEQRFGVPVGLSDHSMGSMGAVVGVSLGACVVEKHVCLSRQIENPDSKFSMEMNEFAQMVQDARNAAVIRGQVSYGPNPGEMENMRFRRSLFAVKDIKAGEVFTDDNVRSIRPAQGLKPKYYRRVIGSKAVCDIKYGEAIRVEMVQNIETDRLQLREIAECDSDLIVKWRSEPDVYPFFCSPHRITKEEHLQWFNNRYLKDDNQISFIVIEKISKEPIGVFGIKKESTSSEHVEVSYLLDKKAQGKGYAQEAILGMIEFAKCQWNSSIVMAEVHKDNTASVKVVERLAFKRESLKGNFWTYKKDL